MGGASYQTPESRTDEIPLCIAVHPLFAGDAYDH